MSRAPAAAVAAVLLSVLVSPLGRELFVGDETKYGEVVREMRAGAFFLPTLNGTPFTHKPPLHFWIVDLLTYPFGLYSIWPFVLPSLIAFALLVALLWRMGGPLAAFVCASSLMIWGSAQTARMDVEFTLLLAYAAWRIAQKDGALPLSAGIAAGVAFLIKGPMAPVIVLALFFFEAWRRKRKPRANDFYALLPMIVIPLLWLVPALIVGGEPFWREIFYKQTVGRAVGAWVHRSPPWFYLVRAPLTTLPWFFLLVAALVKLRRRFAWSWILAVVVPYSLLSSKLDVYMIVLLPAVALGVAELVQSGDVWVPRANALMLALFAVIGIAGLFVQPSQLRGEDAALVALPAVRALFAILLAAAIVGLMVTWRGSAVASTIAVGFVPLVALTYAAAVLMPTINELASTRPLVRALASQPVPKEEIALYVCPYVWTRGMPPELARARQVDAKSLRAMQPRVIVTRRKNAQEIASSLRGFHKSGELRMIGKWFDVYSR